MLIDPRSLKLNLDCKNSCVNRTRQNRPSLATCRVGILLIIWWASFGSRVLIFAAADFPLDQPQPHTQLSFQAWNRKERNETREEQSIGSIGTRRRFETGQGAWPELLGVFRLGAWESLLPRGIRACDVRACNFMCLPRSLPLNTRRRGFPTLLLKMKHFF